LTRWVIVGTILIRWRLLNSMNNKSLLFKNTKLVKRTWDKRQ
jgi:hypothetical protein